jgi:tetratricopeptide (TPR) repeat protein
MFHAIACLLALCPVAAPPQQPEWWAVDRYVVETLLERDRGEWVQEMLAAPMPEDAVSQMVRFNLLVRHGEANVPGSRPSACEQTLAALARHDHAALNGEWSQIVDFLIDRKDDDLARAAIHHLPTAQPGWGYVLVKRMVDGWEPLHIVSTWERTDRWLVSWQTAAMAKLAQREPQPWRGGDDDYWFALRVQLHQQAKTIPWLAETMQKELRANPGDAAAAIRCVTLSHSVDPPQSPQWMLDVVKPAGAYDAHRIGEALAGPWPGIAAAMFERSLALPFDDADEAAMRRLSAMSQRAIGPLQREDLERSLRWQTRAELAEAYQTSDQSAKAQPLIEALARESGEGAPPGLAELAGQVQAATGARVIEGRILEQEEAKADSPEYWTDRAEYFEGRGEHEQAEAAYRKALELSPLDHDPPRFKDTTFRRSLALGRYVRYLRHQHRDADALALIWRELDSVPPDTEYASRMVSEVWHAFSDELNVDNARLWTWLAARPTWEHLEDRVLHRIAERAGPTRRGDPDHRGDVWAKALPLVKDADPSRAAVLGWVMTRHHANDQAVPILRDAIARLEDGEAKQRATFTLFEAYLAMNDATNAEVLWPQARQRLTGREIPQWLGRMIDAAEQSHDAATAQRLAKVRSNLDHRYDKPAAAPDP